MIGADLTPSVTLLQQMVDHGICVLFLCLSRGTKPTVCIPVVLPVQIIQKEHTVSFGFIIPKQMLIIKIVRIDHDILFRGCIILPLISVIPQRLIKRHQHNIAACLLLSLCNQFPQFLLLLIREHIRLIKHPLLRRTLCILPFPISHTACEAVDTCQDKVKRRQHPENQQADFKPFQKSLHLRAPPVSF